jgi:hypothetical protein
LIPLRYDPKNKKLEGCARMAKGVGEHDALQPRTTQPGSRGFICKCTLESVDEGMLHSEQNVYTDHADPRRTEWIVKIQPALKKAKLKGLVRLCKNNLSRREIIELRAGRSKPRRKTLELLKSILDKLDIL